MNSNRTNIYLSVIIIYFNRIDCLIKTIDNIKKHLRGICYEIIISDDGSRKEVIEKIINLDYTYLVLSNKNEGLGANTNKALRLAKGDYILHLQDDWIIDTSIDFSLCLNLFSKLPQLELLRFYDMNSYQLKKYNDDFSVIEKSANLYSYSDTPHLKRNSFHEEYGYYIEGIPMTEMEKKFAFDFEKKNKGICMFYNKAQFVHIGYDQSFNPSIKKQKIKRKIQKIPFSKYFFVFYDKLKRL